MSRVSARQLARQIKRENDIEEFSINEVTRQVKSLRKDGLDDPKIKQRVPEILRLKKAQDLDTEEFKELIDKHEIEIEGIKVNYLPDHLDKDDWT